MDLNAWLHDSIADFVNHSPENSLGDKAGEKAWGEPLVGFSRGTDPLYAQLKQDIGSFYWTPLEIFSKTFPEIMVQADEVQVICWVLPQTEATKRDQWDQAAYPAERWVKSRIYGEEFNRKVGQYICGLLNDSGYPALIPAQSPLWENQTSEKYGFASTWSERHAAFVSGLGTFGLSDGLITPVGKAMRCGSVIARIPLEPTPRPYQTHTEYCLFHSRGICKQCIRRCPAGAITELGHDKLKCRQYQRTVVLDYTKQNYGLESTCCGLCQTKVPCESGIPGFK